MLPYAVFKGCISVSGGCMLLAKELIMVEDIPHVTMQCITSFKCSLCVLAGVSVL